MKKIAFALVGCGRIARKHAHVIHNYMDDATIVAFLDKDLPRALEFAEKYGGAAFSSIPQMMNRLGRKIDMINLLTPSGSHCANILELVEYGKPLVVEKPLALRLEDADRVIAACDSQLTRHKGLGGTGARPIWEACYGYGPPEVDTRTGIL